MKVISKKSIILGNIRQQETQADEQVSSGNKSRINKIFKQLAEKELISRFFEYALPMKDSFKGLVRKIKEKFYYKIDGKDVCKVKFA